MSRTHALSVALVLSLTLAACGGGGGSNSGGGGGGTTPPPTPTPTPTNPCSTALLATTRRRRPRPGRCRPPPTRRRWSTATRAAGWLEAVGPAPLGRRAAAQRARSGPPSTRRATRRAADRHHDARAGHRRHRRDRRHPGHRRSRSSRSIPSTSAALGLRFTRSGSSYTLSRIDGAFRSDARQPRDAHGRRQRADQRFRSRSPTTARRRRVAFVNSDGNITFGRRGQRQHRAQSRPHGHRPAARRAVFRRPRPVDGLGQDLRERRGRSGTP